MSMAKQRGNPDKELEDTSTFYLYFYNLQYLYLYKIFNTIKYFD